MSRSDGLKKRMDERRARLPELIYPPALPILEKREEIVNAVRKHPVVVITGETGSGKTTQIPKMCLEAGRGLAGMIGCTQPRRIAATTVARRIAEELGEETGRSIGYKIRFDDRTPRNAFLKIMTDGILLMEAQTDPLLRTYDTIIVDEAHERSLNIDFILGILKNILRRRRDLRVVITSATIDTEKFSRAFDNAPIIEVSGRLFPVEVRYDPLDRDLEEKGEITHIDAAVRAVEELTGRRRPGDILIFMPTERDIRETRELLSGRLREQAAILPLFSRLTRFEQERVFQPMRLRKIVIATNVAETSLTIPGIRYVIDTGLARISQYNPRSRTAGLPVRAISRSSADQRKGRCGRVENGICIRLFTEEDYLGRPFYTSPEILRANLAGVILRMLSLSLGHIDAFPFIDPPAAKSVKDGIDILLELGAIEREENESRRKTDPWRLTERGRIMARLPIDPRIARMILEAKREGCLPEILIIAAALSIQDPRERPAEKEAQADQMHALFKDPASDFVSLLRIWQRCHDAGDSPKTQNRIRRLCREHFLSYRRIREWRDVHDQLRTILTEQKFLTAKSPAHAKNQTVTPAKAGVQGSLKTMDSRVRGNDNKPKEGVELYAAIHRSILSGYLGHIAVKKEKNLYTATQGRQAMIFPGSGLFNRAGNWIVAAEMVETSRLFARTVANIESAWLEELGGDLCRHTYFAPHWEKNRGEVIASEQVTLFGLIIVPERPVSYARIDPAEASRIFIRSALVAGEVQRPLPFLLHNQALMEKIAGMEEKVRRHDLLIGEEEMAHFYEKRLPGIFDIRTLQRMVRDRGGDAFLRMREEELLIQSPDSAEIALFPEAVSTGGWRLDCVYRYEPGKPEDGVTLKIPVQAAPSVPAAALDWAVPGLLRKKIAALLRGLPKEYRKKLLPLAGTCDVILAQMPREGTLLTALGRFLYERFGVNIPADRWPLNALEEHLKLRFSVVDGKDRELAAGRDIAILEQGFVDPEESRAFAKARKTWERNGLTTWDFGNLPEQIPLRDGGIHAPPAFPALSADETGVGIRLFRSANEARLSHRKGVRALLALRFREDLRHLRKTVAPAGDLKIWAAAFGGVKPLENALVEKVMTDLFDADVRSEADFVQHAEKIRPEILPGGISVVRLAGPQLRALYETAEQLRTLQGSNRGNRPLLSFLAELREESTRLLPPDFLVRYNEERLNHINRYLRALGVRAERGAVHLQKALERGKQIKELEDWRETTLKELPAYASEEKRLALADFGWMIEEYKVSLFAQELKTAIPISRKRIEARMAEIQRML
ncbi:MAG: ATP-dependent RNA helicase HrpA [Deltaproteobacteria bacterium]|nr:ATP-dependent RNA helicase HrpA [Deltaproteobacteria bacterium]